MVLKLNKVIMAVFILQSLIFAQTDWTRWEAKSVSYEMKSEKKFTSVVSVSGSSGKLISAARSVYKFFISDLDGDNCPFYPSCSQFYVDAVNETNLIRGTLMFIDRFTRDINFFKGWNSYPIHASGKFFDPAYNYTLDYRKINFQPSNTADN